MKIFVLVIALIMVSVGVYSNKFVKDIYNEEPPTDDASSAESQISELPHKLEVEVMDQNGNEGKTEGALEEYFSPTPSVDNYSIDGYIYPNSVIINKGSWNLQIKSSDQVDLVTEWYENKIKSEGMNTKSFVKTKTNNNVSNKLVGVNSNREISVEITKDSNQNEVFVILRIINK